MRRLPLDDPVAAARRVSFAAAVLKTIRGCAALGEMFRFKI
jgi:hypothetical protein